MLPRENVVFKFRNISNLIKRRVDEIINKNYHYNVTSIHVLIARYLHQNKEKDIFQKDIEEEFCIRGSTTTNILKLMEKNKMIKRERVEYDGRLKKIVLTKKCKEIHKTIFSEMLNLEDVIFKGLSKEEIKNFCEILDKIKNNIS